MEMIFLISLKKIKINKTKPNSTDPNHKYKPKIGLNGSPQTNSPRPKT